MSQFSAGWAILVLFLTVSWNLPEVAPPPPEDETVLGASPESLRETSRIVDVAVRLGEARMRARRCLEHCACQSALDEMATVNDLRRDIDRTIAALKDPGSLAKVDARLEGLEVELRFWDAMAVVGPHTRETAPEYLELLKSTAVLIEEARMLVAKAKPETVEGLLEWLEHRDRSTRLTEAIEAMKKKMAERETHRRESTEEGKEEGDVLPPVPIRSSEDFFT